MNKFCAFLTLVTLLFSATPVLADSTPTFANISWGTSATGAQAKLEAKGFEYVKTDSDGDYDFRGEINGQKVVLYEFLNPARKVVKIEIGFLTADDEVLDYYNNLKDTLSSKYGPPTKTFGWWEQPYTDEDPAFEHQTALAVGRGHFSAFWGDGLWMQITKRLTVDVSYESPSWANELARRNHAGNASL